MTPSARTRRPSRFLVSLLVAVLAATSLLIAPVLPAGDASAARVVGDQRLSPTVSLLSVYSPSMNRVVRNHVVHPAGRPAGLPSFYLLPGAGGAEDGISWFNHGGVRSFFAGKRVNVVLPIGGRFSMMTDWNADDPMLGRNKWQTYVTSELPTAIDRHLRTSGRAAVGGVSMSAGPALDLVIQAPRRFQAVAAYSGCPGTTDPAGILSATSIPLRGGGNPGNMWGPPGSPQWTQHDPVVNAERLRGKAIYLAAASGVPGAIDGGPLEVLGAVFGGGVVEAVAQHCTVNMHNRLNQLGIAHKATFFPQGAHTWGLFNAQLRDSWPTIRRAIGA